MCNLLFDNFLNVFFKIPNAFFTTFLSLYICLLKYISKIMCFTFVCIFLVKNHEPRQKWATFISQYVGPNTILCSMFKIEQIMIGCFLIKGLKNIKFMDHSENLACWQTHFKIASNGQPLLASLYCIIMICMKRNLMRRCLQVFECGLCAIFDCTMNWRKITKLFETYHDSREIIPMWSLNLVSKNNVDYINTFWITILIEDFSICNASLHCRYSVLGKSL
jgi:hypothetical protein